MSSLIELLLRAGTGLSSIGGSCTNILEHREALWRFVSKDGVEPTNNHAEQELRGFVLWRKTTLGSQSERGDRFAANLKSVIHTCRKQRRHVLSYLTEAIHASLSKQSAPSLLGHAPSTRILEWILEVEGAMHAIEIDQRRFCLFAEDFLRRHFERLNVDEKDGFRSELAVASSFPAAFEKYYSDLQALAPVRLEEVQSGVVKQRSDAARAAGGALFPYRVEVGAVLVGRKGLRPNYAIA